MSSCSLPLVLLVLICVQSFTLAQDPIAPSSCCFTFKRKVPVQLITKYEETHRACYHPGIVFIMKSGRRVCADPRDQWVKEHMDNVDLLYMQAQTELKFLPVVIQRNGGAIQPVVRGPLDEVTGLRVQGQRTAGLTEKSKFPSIPGRVGGLRPKGTELGPGPRHSESRPRGQGPQGLAGLPSATTTRSPCPPAIPAVRRILAPSGNAKRAPSPPLGPRSCVEGGSYCNTCAIAASRKEVRIIGLRSRRFVSP